MSSFEFSWDDSSSEEEFEWDEDEDIAIKMMVHVESKRPKNGGFLVGREVICRWRLDGDNKVMLDYFWPNQCIHSDTLAPGSEWLRLMITWQSERALP